MATPALPFQDWTQEECEFLLEILGKNVLNNAALNRLLIHREFSRIRSDSEDIRKYYFREAKNCCQEQLGLFIKDGTRGLRGMTLKERAKRVMVHKYRSEAFLVEISRCLGIYSGEEVAFSRLSMRLSLGVGGEGFFAAFDRITCWMIRGVFCSSRGCADYMVGESEPRVFFDQYLQEELEILEGLVEKDFMGVGVRAMMRRGKNFIKYMVSGRESHYGRRLSRV